MQNSRKKVITLGYVALVLCVLAVTASYAWMSISSAPSVTDLGISVVTSNQMLLAPDEDGKPGAWGSVLDLSGYENLSSTIRPVTFDPADNCFYAPDYGWDGRVSFKDPTRLTDPDGNIPDWKKTDGYLYTFDFWVTAPASDCIVGLAEPTERIDDTMGAGTFLVDEAVWDENTNSRNIGSGAQNTIRIAFCVYGDGKDPEWIFYEPSYEEGKETKSIRGDKLEGSHRLIRQEPTSWDEKETPIRGEVVYRTGRFADDPGDLFRIEAGRPKRVRVFLWMEGQDPDCNAAAKGGAVTANFQFAGRADTENSMTSE